MGIEPTDRLLDRRPNGFEDRAVHQHWTHFLGAHADQFYPCGPARETGSGGALYVDNTG